ncbi:hypothetical protein R70006_05026 [Paraburkholderia domus]|uniref:hypothetical protein n=1 Tax=Paraburkholderia domus TaxID=2793075 RepID=UPI0019140A4E|nr:hypothetical protein [Paraburkholderia domus]MBK5051737.1 hypothetical protein [Burkholderia sp. R-70006]CAE6794913.1 hypothetical protein R70006_05026 [Paraburkholderia domus]
MTIKFKALPSTTSGENDAERRMAESEEAIELASRGKPARGAPAALAGDAAPADVSAPASDAEAPGVPADPEAESAWVAEGGAPRADVDDKVEPVAEAQGDLADAAAPAESGLSELAQLAAGTISKDDVVLKAPSAATAKILKDAPADKFATDADLSDLLSRMDASKAAAGRGKAELKTAPEEPAKAVTEAHSAQKQGVHASGAGAVPAAAQTVGDVIGQGIAGVVAAPFLALSSAKRHLNQRFGSAAQQARPEVVGAAQSAGMPLEKLSTLEKVTSWKCEQIEKSASAVLAAAQKIRDTDGYVLWEDRVTVEANKRGVAASEIVERMRSDADLAPLREQMTALWHENPDQIANFRREADAFEKHLKDVRSKFANSDGATQARVSGAMKEVEEGTSDLPGFDKQEGEYTASLSERVRELARALYAMVQALISRLTGASVDSPEMSG